MTENSFIKHHSVKRHEPRRAEAVNTEGRCLAEHETSLRILEEHLRCPDQLQLSLTLREKTATSKIGQNHMKNIEDRSF